MSIVLKILLVVNWAGKVPSCVGSDGWVECEGLELFLVDEMGCSALFSNLIVVIVEQFIIRVRLFVHFVLILYFNNIL